MAEAKNDDEEHALPAKRKPELCSVGKDVGEGADLKKKQKLGTCSDNNSTLAQERQADEDGCEYDDDEEDYEAEEAEDEDEDEDDDGDRHSNGEAEVDRKGKGILRDDKGKGKIVEESDNSSDGEAESDGDSDLSDDPLAEVDLDNILPSRTRRRPVQPGVYLSNDLGNNNDDRDSDDSDA